MTPDHTIAAAYSVRDLHADIDDHVFDIDPLLEWAARDDAADHEASEEPEP